MTKEAARYLGIKEVDEITAKYIEEAEKEASVIVPAYISACFTAVKEERGIKLEGTDIVLEGKLAENHFYGCKKIISVIATLGLKSEILLKKVFATNAAKAVVLDAVYTAKIEEFLDKTERELSEKYGVKINECYMLTPNKSVIALIGVK